VTDRIKVLIVDDSRLFRGTIAEIITALPEFVVVGSVFNGVKAVEFLTASSADLVLLDQEMPELDGMGTLAAIGELNRNRHKDRPVAVVMVSAYTSAAADLTVQALTSGAFDFVTKPTNADGPGGHTRLRTDVTAKLRAFAASRNRTAPHHLPSAPEPQRRSNEMPRANASSNTGKSSSAANPVAAIAIACSTGGPRALSELLPALCGYFSTQPIFIVQHMPQGFTASLAQSIAKQTARPCVEATDKLLIEPGTIYLAPGGKHMNVRRMGNALAVGLPDLPPENGCRPAADVLFRSAADCYGQSLLAIILTGMGNDGAAGLAHVKRAGGRTIAQDQATSIVWGMPGSAVTAGVVDEIHPLQNIAVACDLFVRRELAKRKANTP